MNSQFSPPISGEGRRIGHLDGPHTSGARRPGPAAFAAGFGIVAAVLLGIVVVAAVGSRWAAFTLALAALLSLVLVVLWALAARRSVAARFTRVA